jgi:hypothetical protein
LPIDLTPPKAPAPPADGLSDEERAAQLLDARITRDVAQILTAKKGKAQDPAWVATKVAKETGSTEPHVTAVMVKMREAGALQEVGDEGKIVLTAAGARGDGGTPAPAAPADPAPALN